jgi:carbon monoxide dehydrogenase subunit G
MAPPVIDYTGSFHLALPPGLVWSAIEKVDRFEVWWPWLSEFRLDGPGSGLRPGRVLHGVVAPPVPYRMRIDVELLACVRPRSIEARVSGDLRGPARLRLGKEGDGTRAEVAWTIEMMQLPMRLASRFGHPLLRWGHDRVVETTVAGFGRHAEREAGLGHPGHSQGRGQ